jgi:hypothetical protein
MDRSKNKWIPPQLNLSEVGHGDMPGDQIRIDDSHIERANTVFPLLFNKIKEMPADKIVLSVYGGSGVGKSEIGSLLAHYFSLEGYASYILSGDNYPRRIPALNDAERLNRFRSAGLAAIAASPRFSDEWNGYIHESWEDLADADPAKALNHEGFEIYQKAGKAALQDYLATDKEIDFSLLNDIIRRFKEGVPKIPLKRMGRVPEDVHLESVDFSGTSILIIEWTHGNHPALKGVDFPVFLFSTPQETLTHRLARGRDSKADSSFVNLVLEIEQDILNKQAESAALIVRKNGHILSFEDFKENFL